MKACLTTEEMSAEEAVRRAVEGEGVIGMDYVREVTAPVGLPMGSAMTSRAPSGRPRAARTAALPPIRHRIVAYDYGIKENILRRLRQNGFGVTVVPATATAEEVLELNRRAFSFPTGPGDPSVLDYAHQAVRGPDGPRRRFLAFVSGIRCSVTPLADAPSS